jgi:hypothetical protein
MLAVGGLVVLPVACSSDEQAAPADLLQRSEVEAIADTEALLRSVALEGVTDDAAVAAVARAAADPAVVLALGTDFVDLVPRFLTAVLDADADQLSSLVTLGVDGLGRAAYDQAQDLLELVDDVAANPANQRDYLESAAFDIDDYFAALAAACEDTGIDPDTRWQALTAALDLAAMSLTMEGSFTATLDPDAVASLTVDEDRIAPDDVVDLIAEAGDPLQQLLATAVHEDPDARALFVADPDASVADLRAVPLLADVLDPGNGVLGRPLSEALFAFVAS